MYRVRHQLSFVIAATAALLLAANVLARAAGAAAPPDRQQQLEAGKRAILARAGCFLVDYSFVETEVMKPGYTKDNRVYDVNRDKAVKEWILPEQLSPTRIRLQHVLFATDTAGKLKEGALLKHTGEDWQFDAPFLYDFAGHGRWNVKPLTATPGVWTRRVTSLDDGLRYQCAAPFNLKTANPEWSCQDYAPIPGRETRDMSRKDYQGLDRLSHLILYGPSWLERERNTKTIETGDARTPLVKEVGKTWYVRLPDSDCAEAQDFAKKRLAFWLVMVEAWDEVLTGNAAFEDPAKAPKPSRYERFMDLEEQYLIKDMSNPGTHNAARQALLQIITATRAKPMEASGSGQ